MTAQFFLAASLLLAAPLSYAQGTPQPAPAPNAPNAPAPPRPMRGREMDGNRSDRGWGRDGMRNRPMGNFGGSMRGPGDGLLPLGMWWKNPEVVTRIGLSTEQQKHIDDLFLQSRVQLIHIHAALEEEQLLLEPLLDASPFDQAKALAQINKIADSRADLEKANAKMLLSIRGVLSADQWTKLQTRNHGMRRMEAPSRNAGPNSQPKAN